MFFILYSNEYKVGNIVTVTKKIPRSSEATIGEVRYSEGSLYMMQYEQLDHKDHNSVVFVIIRFVVKSVKWLSIDLAETSISLILENIQFRQRDDF